MYKTFKTSLILFHLAYLAVPCVSLFSQTRRLFKFSRSLSSSMQSAVWDAESGVWLGDRAPFDGSKLPDPLYILGYGSLIWRPGDLLEKYKSYKCTAIGSMRLFAQKSCDHRGTPEFPGLVLNLVEDEVLEECGYRLPGAPQSEFRGLVFHVPHEDVQRVIEELDFRERGGYHRHIIPVKLDNACDGQEGRVVDAIVYTGAPSNPNFLLPKIRRRQSLDAAETDPDTQQEARSDPFCLHRRNIMTDTIAAAVGPSGPNVDYLCNLDRYLGTSDMGDSFLSSLAASVRLRLGPWRGRLYRSADVVSTSNALEDAVRSVSGPALPYRLLGWGSNEFLQLSDQPAPLAVLDAGNQDTSLLAHRYLGAAISDSIPPALSASATTATSAETSTQTPPPPSPDQPHFSDTEGRHVEAGGGSSALLQDGALRVWGKLASALMQLTSDPAGPHSPEQSIVLAGVQGVALGHDHLLLLLQWPVSPGGGTDGAAAPTVEVVLAVGSDSHGQCSGSAAACAALGVPMLRQEDVVLTARQGQPCVYELYLRAGAPITDFMVRTEGAPCPAAVLKLAVGMRHSALITVDGALLTWGDHSHGQALLLSGAADDHPDDGASSATWRPPNGAKLVDVACGAKYTVLIDSLGEVYRLGGAKKRTEARSSLPMRVEGLPERVRWQRVESGWGHVVLRGLNAEVDRELCFYAWGRRQLSQYPVRQPSAEAESEDAPRELAPLPQGHRTAEVWCGSEFTLAADEHGRLWGCGWNEHGNVGCGVPVAADSTADRAGQQVGVVGEWRPVLQLCTDEQQQVQLAHVWPGAVACGGGHVLCLPDII